MSEAFDLYVNRPASDASQPFNRTKKMRKTSGVSKSIISVNLMVRLRH